MNNYVNLNILCLLYAVLPTIGCSQQQAVTEAKTVGILRGDLSAIPPVEADAVRVYLCYVFEGDYSYCY